MPSISKRFSVLETPEEKKNENTGAQLGWLKLYSRTYPLEQKSLLERLVTLDRSLIFQDKVVLLPGEQTMTSQKPSVKS